MQFWDKVDMSGGVTKCWPFLGAVYKSRGGYGRTTHNGKEIKAHRLAYLLTYGHLPDIPLLHSCDSPICCNPCHLRPGTDADNTKDKVSRNRQAKGNDFPWTKLTNEAIHDIRTTTGWGSGERLAKKYNVCRATISQVRSRKSFKHILG